MLNYIKLTIILMLILLITGIYIKWLNYNPERSAYTGLEGEWRRGKQEYFDDEKVKRIIYVFWTGSNPMTENRKKGINNLKTKTGINMCLITPDNLNDYILKDYPLHQSYKYLSRIHKSDYLRCYFMHHYGGGYSDVKSPSGSWVKHFDRINNDPNIWVIGLGKDFNIEYPEEYNNHQRMILRSYYSRLTSTSFMICRPRTKYTLEWYNILHKKLDYFSLKLEKHPAVFSREAYDRSPSHWFNDEKDPELKKLGCPKERTKYPISWTKILGQIIHPLQVKYISHIKTGLPKADHKNYA